VIGEFEEKLIVFILFFYSFGFFLSQQIFIPKPVYLNNEVNSSSVVYLPGVLDLRDQGTMILGTESEVKPEDVVFYVNEERKKIGAPPLKISPTLQKAAQMRAEVMMRTQNFSHQDPITNIQLDSVLPLVGYPFSYASENIALAQGNSAGFVAGWMNSPSHKKNLLDPSLTETGVGVVDGKFNNDFLTVAVQLFAIPTTTEKYKGYSDKDIQGISDSITKVERELQKVNSILSNGTNRVTYYTEWKTILERQKEILNTVYSYMKSGQPYKKEQQDLISEYNANWGKAPK